jgi:hypothetical protein
MLGPCQPDAVVPVDLVVQVGNNSMNEVKSVILCFVILLLLT